ncbi:MAG: redoxin domain-containing protein [Gemmatimonadetes bacterium]|nr:redoxin domain-containing protein [Gemmatimonadota bacterium]
MTRVPQWLRQSLVFAGAWHLVLGASIMIAPGTFFTLTGLAHPNYVQMWQGAGLLAAVMGIGYAIAARNPLRYWPVILIGLIPKIISPIGVVWDFWQRELPTALGTLVLVNDVVWWVPFSMLLWYAVREEAAGEYPRSIYHGTPRDAMANAITNHGESLLQLSEVEPLMVVFVRHSGCIFCRETLSELHTLRAAIDETGVGLVVVHMDMPDEGEALIERYGLDGVDVISDPLRELYQAFHLQQGSFTQLFGPRVLARGFVATLKGHLPGWFVGDALQMPGAFVVSHGAILRAYRHTSAGDRPDYLALATGECDLPNQSNRGDSAA